MLLFIARVLGVFGFAILFANTGSPYLMLASALCMGAVIGSEWGEYSVASLCAFAVVMFFDSASFAVKGAVMTNYFFPWADAHRQMGLANFFMLVFIGIFFVAQLNYTWDYVEKKKEEARSAQ